MGNGRISQHQGNFGHAQAFFVQEIPRMFHSLALVEIENGRSEHLFKPFFQIAFVDGDFSAELSYRERFSDVLQEYFARLYDLFPVRLICQELTLKAFRFLLSDHAFKAVQQQHLALGIDEDVGMTARITVTEQGVQDQTGPAAKRKRFGKRGCMPEFEETFADRGRRFPRSYKLGQMYRKESEGKDVHRSYPF